MIRGYVSKRKGQWLFFAGLLAAVNIYFGYMCASAVYVRDLLYLDFLLSVTGLCAGIWDYRKWSREEEKRREEREGRQEQEEEISRLYGEIMDLTDYIAQWTHEVKLPIAALRLMNERNGNLALQKSMQDAIVRTELLVNHVMLGNKLKKPEYDVKFEKFLLEDAVKEALKNQSYFLIREQFQIEHRLAEVFVYSDRRWLVYLLDQLVGNAIKYRGEEAKLCFWAERAEDESVVLNVKDSGIGIEEEELPYIFDKGYVGNRMRKPDYRSTGMGLYFVRQIAGMLGIQITVISERDKGCRFVLQFLSKL